MNIIKNHSKLSVHFSERMQAVKYRLHEDELARQRNQRNELENLRTKITEQVDVMLENDQIEEAWAITSQLKKMMPEDLDVAALVMKVLLK